jgi:hypothetical protein
MADFDKESISHNSDEEAYRHINPAEFKQTLILKPDELGAVLKRLRQNWTRSMAKESKVWSERPMVTHAEKIEDLDNVKINDDTLREVQFYNIAKGNADRGLVLCEKEGISLDRPQDFMADMIKSDKVMAKIRSGLVQHQVRIQNYEEKKMNKANKKFLKQKKHKKNLDAAVDKKKTVAAMDKWKRALKQKGDNAPDLNKFISGEKALGNQGKNPKSFQNMKTKKIKKGKKNRPGLVQRNKAKGKGGASKK